MLKNYKSVFFAPVVVAIVFAICFALNGFFPFGKSSVSWCDMTQQVIPLLCDFKDILLGKEGFFFGFQNAGGMNFFGVFFFFLASPFSFLVIFFDKAEIPLLMNVLLVLKLCVCGASAALYFEKRFKNLSLDFKLILSVCYAFCGYGMMFYQNIIWLDIMYLFPLLMLGIHYLIEKGSVRLLIASLTAIIIVNFYISYMVILFVVLYFGIHTICSKKRDYMIYVKLGVSAVVSLMLSAVVWIPSFAQYISSGRKSKIVEGLKHCNFFTETETCVPLILATSLIFALLGVFLTNLENKSDGTKLSVIVFAVMCIPVFIEPINLMWHTGNYMSFPVRYGFITVFSGLIVCANLLSDIESVKGKRFANLLAIVFSAPICVFVIWYTKKHLETLSRYAQTLWGNEQSYHGILILFLVLFFVEAVVIFLTKRKILSKKIMALILASVVICEGYSSLLIYVTPSKDDLDIKKYTAFCGLEDKINDDEFYRVNMSHKLIDANMTGAIGYNSLGHYTSLTDSNYMQAIKVLGYSGYWMEIGNWGGNVISDALMAVKYRINETEQGAYRIVENSNVLGLITPSDAKLTQELPKTDRALAVGDVFADMFSLEKNPVTEYEMTSYDGCDYFVINGNHKLMRYYDSSTITYQIEVKGEQTLYFDCFDGGSNNLEEPINDAFSVYVNGNHITQSYPSQNKNGMLELGTFKDERVIVFLRLNKDVECYSFGVFGFDVQAINQAINEIKSYEVKVKAGGVSAKTPDDYSGEMFISLPYNEGYKITLDGEKIDYKRCLTGFMSINVANGGELKISFIPQGFILGLTISIIGIVCVILLWRFGKRLDSLPDVIKKSVIGLFVAIFSLFLIVIYILPVALNLLY